MDDSHHVDDSRSKVVSFLIEKRQQGRSLCSITYITLFNNQAAHLAGAAVNLLCCGFL